MNPTHPKVWKAALVSGVPLGVLAALPVIGLCLNVCCCALAAFAGFFAALFYLSETEPAGPPPYGDGLLTGFLSGAIGAAVLVLSKGFFAGIMAFTGWRPRISGLEDMLEGLPPALGELVGAYLSGAALGLAAMMGAFAFWLLIYGTFGAVGGVVSVAMFHDKREGSPRFGQEPPPAPPSVPPPPP